MDLTLSITLLILFLIPLKKELKLREDQDRREKGHASPRQCTHATTTKGLAHVVRKNLVLCLIAMTSTTLVMLVLFLQEFIPFLDLDPENNSTREISFWIALDKWICLHTLLITQVH